MHASFCVVCAPLFCIYAKGEEDHLASSWITIARILESFSLFVFCTVNIIVFTSFDIIGCCRVLFSPCSCVYVALRISQNEQIWPQCPNCIRNATFVCLYIYDLQKHQQRICQCNINDMLPCYTIVDRDGGQGWEKPFYVPFHAPNG